MGRSTYILLYHIKSNRVKFFCATRAVKFQQVLFNICFIQVTRKQGQFGIISCIAISPEINGLYACGSFSKSSMISYYIIIYQ